MMMTIIWCSVFSRLRTEKPVVSMADHHLHFAAENGYLQIVKDLVEGEPSLVNERGEHGGTPLMFAAFGGQVRGNADFVEVIHAYLLLSASYLWL
jgi:ankyrin repeat protein